MLIKKIKYPDGQLNVECYLRGDYSYNYSHIVQRINSYEDLAALSLFAECMDYNNLEKKELVIPWMFGQRSDRRFSDHSSFGLKIITDQINNCGFKNVTLFDPHSDVSLALIKNSRKDTTRWNYIVSNVLRSNLDLRPVLISPDAGAYKKIYQFATDNSLEIIGANKHRDSNGKISIRFTEDVTDRYCLIIDDICEYGNTFKNLSLELKKNGAKSVLLYVSHFSGGGPDKRHLLSNTIENLLLSIDHIYTTDSVMPANQFPINSNLTVYEIFNNESFTNT